MWAFFTHYLQETIGGSGIEVDYSSLHGEYMREPGGKKTKIEANTEQKHTYARESSLEDIPFSRKVMKGKDAVSHIFTAIKWLCYYNNKL